MLLRQLQCIGRTMLWCKTNALVQDGVHHMGEQRRGGTMGDRKTLHCKGTMGGNTGTGGDECKAGRMVTPGGRYGRANACHSC